ncbi:MAG: insulinase family protein, partial [Rickettsiales bacterium]|nr:insulinase family protein [Rickettsiales bacterium]
MKNFVIILVIFIVVAVVALLLFRRCNIKVGSSIEGFKVVEKEIVFNNGKQEIFYKLQHKKTDAIVYYVLNDDEHRFFNISFNAPINDKTGVAHILEHSVLSSTTKYKAKDMFFSLNKKSPATFLNAATADGQIFYYFQTADNKDFMNTMDVYLDTALFPELSKNTFKKEGWRLQVDEDENLFYNGVVYNEMKTAYAQPLYNWLMPTQEQYFPSFEFQSGGNPEYIPSLGYEQFVQFYKDTHNPSNALTVIYGKGDIRKELGYLNKEFNKFEREEAVKLDYENKIVDKPFSIKVPYPAGAGETSNYVVFSYILGDVKDPAILNKYKALKFLLTDYESAPLKKNILDAGLATEVEVFDDPVKDKFGLYIMAQGVKTENIKKLQEVFDKTMNDLAQKGFGEKAESAVESFIKFQIFDRQMFEYPEDIIFYYPAYLFGGDLTLMFKKQKQYDEYRNRLEGSWKDIIKKSFIENQQKGITVAYPDTEMSGRQDAELKEKLAKMKASLSKEEFEQIKKEDQEYKKFEVLDFDAEFPLITSKDWKDKDFTVQTDRVDYKDVKILYHNFGENGLMQNMFAFDIKNIEQDKLSAVGVYALLSDKLGTYNKSNEDFVLEQFKILGQAITSELLVTSNYKDDESVARYIINVKGFADKSKEAYDLLEQYIFDMDYSDEKKIKEIVAREIERIEIDYRQSGYPVFTSYSQVIIIGDMIAGEKYYLYLKNMLANWDEEYPKMLSDFNYLKNNLFVRNNLVVDIVSKDEDLLELKNFLNLLKSGGNSFASYDFELIRKNEARITPARNYYNYKRCKLDTKENWIVQFLPEFITFNYLYPEVRINGGAYGSRIVISPNKDALFASWADPNIKKTFEAYDKTARFLRNFYVKSKDFEGIKIKALSRFSFPKTPFVEGESYLRNFLMKRYDEDKNQEYQKIKNLQISDINNLSSVFENCGEGVIASVGMKEGIE